MKNIDGIEYCELDNSPRLRYTRKGVNAVRVFHVPNWEEVQRFARLLIGSYQRVGASVTIVPPLAFPGFSQMLVSDLAIDPLMPDSPRGDDLADLENETNAYDQGAIVTASYTTEYDGEQSGDVDIEIPEGTTLVVTQDNGMETYSTPGRVWRWGTVAGNPVVDPDTFAGIQIPTGEWSLVWGRVPLPPWDVMRATRGKLNNVEFMGSPAGTVLFAGQSARRMFQFVEETELWELTYRFREQIKTRNDATEVGWNYFYREQASGGEHWHTIQDVTGNPPFKSADFSELFKFPVVVP